MDPKHGNQKGIRLMLGCFREQRRWEGARRHSYRTHSQPPRRGARQSKEVGGVGTYGPGHRPQRGQARQAIQPRRVRFSLECVFIFYPDAVSRLDFSLFFIHGLCSHVTDSFT